jgi:hypothetical protein
MQDKESATLMLSAILQMPVLDLDFNAQDFNLETDYFSVFRVDFKAKIKKSDGQEILVLIELQKIKFSTADIFRFRTYLGQQYLSKTNINEKKQPLPIITIYILGHYLESYQDSPILRIKRQIIEHGTEKVLEQGKSDFIEMLTHDSIIIQIPALKKKAQKTDELEKLLDIFELVKEQKIEFDEKKVSRDYFPVLRRLHKAIQNEQIQAIMMVEDEFVEGIKEKEAEILDALKRAEQAEKIAKQEKQRAEQAEEIVKQEKERAEQEKERAEQAEEIAKQEKERAEQEKQRAKQEKERAEQEKILTIRKLLEKGFSVEEIIEIANVDTKFLKKHDLLK